MADDIVEMLRKGGHKINEHHCEICDAYCFRFELCECCWAALGRTRQAADEIDRLRAVIARVDALHYPRTVNWVVITFCPECDTAWPCPTHLALHREEAQHG